MRSGWRAVLYAESRDEVYRDRGLRIPKLAGGDGDTRWDDDVPNHRGALVVKMAAAHDGKTVKEFLIELTEAEVQELEQKGILPKGK